MKLKAQSSKVSASKSSKRILGLRTNLSLHDSRLPSRLGTARSGQVLPESALDWYGAYTRYNLTCSSYPKYQGHYRCSVSNLKPASSHDPVNLLSPCFGYCSPLLRWDRNRFNVTKVLSKKDRCDRTGQSGAFPPRASRPVGGHHSTVHHIPW